MSREELEACIKKNGRDIYSFCCRLTGSRQEADDLYQDTFLKMVELGDRLDIRSNPKGYLLSVSVNLWRNRRRKWNLRQQITGPVTSMEDAALEVPSREPSPEARIISGEQKRLVQEAVAGKVQAAGTAFLYGRAEALRDCRGPEYPGRNGEKPVVQGKKITEKRTGGCFK